jgi:O-antigen ligase
MAALVPFGALASLLSNVQHILWTNATMFAFVASWMLVTRTGGGTRRQFGPVSCAAILLGIIVVASCIAQIPGLNTGGFFETVWRIAARDLFFVGRRTAGLGEGLAWLLGLALFGASVSLCRGQPRQAQALAMTIVGAAVVAASLNILVALDIGFVPVLQRARLLGGRFIAHISDVNAGGAYFAMTACLALGLAPMYGRVARTGLVVATVVLTTGMWLTASWSAVAAGLGGIVLLLLYWTSKALGWALTPRLVVVVTGVVLAVGLFALAGTMRMLTAETFIVRQQFLETGLRMLASAPVFGVGVGMFHPLSRRFMGPQLGWSYGLENAHNYFLQIAAELGLVGLAAFLYFLYAVWTRVRPSLSRRSHVFGAVTAAGAFLATFVTGHPLLVREVGYPFWMLLGLMVAWAESPATVTEPHNVSWRRPGLVLAATAVAVFASVPFRIEAPTRQTVVYGVYDWELQPDGSRARWTEQYATIVVRVETGGVDIPMRAPETVEFLIAVDGVPLKYESVSNAWRRVQVTLPPPAPEVLYRRIDIRLPRSWPLAKAQTGSRDPRLVGLQLGELSLSPVR